MIAFEKNSVNPNIKLEVCPCPPFSHEVFTFSPIEKGEFLLKYEGQIIKHKENLEREKVYSQFPDIRSYVLYIGFHAHSFHAIVLLF